MREEEAEVGVASLRFAEESDVSTALQRHFGAGDGAHAERFRCLGERHRAVEAVVVREGEGVVAELAGAECQLLGRRCALAEGVAGVAVELNVRS